MGPRADDRITAEQAALRRVAALVVSGAAPEEVFAAVAAEAGRLLGADLAGLGRYDPDGATAYLARWSAAGNDLETDVRSPPRGRTVSTLVLETGEPARIDDFSQSSEEIADAARMFGVRSSVGAPVSVGDRLWGVLTVASTGAERLPADTEVRLAAFGELAAATIAKRRGTGAGQVNRSADGIS